MSDAIADASWVPYFVRKFIRRDKTATLKPLYTFDDDKSTTSSERGSINHDKKGTEASHLEQAPKRDVSQV